MTTMIGYLRVSTDEQATSGLGLEAQRETIQRYADTHGWDVVWYEDAGQSGKNMDRPALQAALQRLHPNPKTRDVEGIVVAKLDRLSRSVVNFGRMLELARARKWSLVAIDLGVDTGTPTGRLVANMMMAVAEWERDTIGERTSAAMQAAKRKGKHMGRRSTLSKASAERLLKLREEGMSFPQIAATLNAEGVPTAQGGAWHTSTVVRAHARLAHPTKDTSAALSVA